jgi:hypothetical protein
MSLTAAIAIETSETIFEGHFGSASFWNVYEISPDAITFKQSIENPFFGHHHDEGKHNHHDEHHANKPQTIISLFTGANVQLLVGGGYGGNVRMLKQHFLPVLTHVGDINEFLSLLQQHYAEIEAQFNEADRKIIRIG